MTGIMFVLCAAKPELRPSRVLPFLAVNSQDFGYFLDYSMVVVNAMDEKPYQITTAVDSECTISAFEKSGGVLAPYFASRVSEASSNLSEIAEEIVVHPVMHVPGTLNPADIATRATAQPEDVMQGRMWQNGPDYLLLPRTEWPLSRNFLN